MKKFLQQHGGELFLAASTLVGITLLVTVLDKVGEKEKLVEQRNKACYSQQMILVETTAGWYCAPLNSLVKVK